MVEASVPSMLLKAPPVTRAITFEIDGAPEKVAISPVPMLNVPKL